MRDDIKKQHYVGGNVGYVEYTNGERYHVVDTNFLPTANHSSHLINKYGPVKTCLIGSTERGHCNDWPAPYTRCRLKSVYLHDGYSENGVSLIPPRQFIGVIAYKLYGHGANDGHFHSGNPSEDYGWNNGSNLGAAAALIEWAISTVKNGGQLPALQEMLGDNAFDQCEYNSFPYIPAQS